MTHSNVKWMLVLIPLRVNSLFRLAGPTNRDNRGVTEKVKHLASKKDPDISLCPRQTEGGQTKIQQVAGKTKRRRTPGGRPGFC